MNRMVNLTREKAADLLDNLIGTFEDNQNNDYDAALRMGIEALKLQRVRGQWIDMNGDGKLFRCSNCDEIVCCAQNNYCPNCGAKMTEGEQE